MRISSSLLALTLVLGCTQQSGSNTEGGPAPSPLREGSGEVVAEVGKTKIHASDVLGRINEKPKLIREQLRKDNRALAQQLDTMIEEELLLQIAKERGYDRDPRIQHMVRLHLMRLVREDIYKTVKLDDVTDAQLKEHYEKHKAGFQLPLRIRARQIVVATQKEAQALAKKLAKADEAHFAALAQKQSLDLRSKGRGGDLGWHSSRRLTLPKAIWEALSKLKKPGEIAGPVQTKVGWHVLRVTAIQPSRVPELKEVALQVKMATYRARRAQKMAKLLHELRQRFPVKGYPQKLEALKTQIK